MGGQTGHTRSVGDITSSVYSLLKDIEPEDRLRVVKAALALFGESDGSAPPPPGARNVGGNNPKSFFEEKNPQSKGEELAVAARFLETIRGKESCLREELQQTITDARRNFDNKNFTADMNNATGQSGFFNRGTKRGQYKLSYYGQKYIDALPDREVAKKLRKPIRKYGKTKKKNSKRSTPRT